MVSLPKDPVCPSRGPGLFTGIPITGSRIVLVGGEEGDIAFFVPNKHFSLVFLMIKLICLLDWYLNKCQFFLNDSFELQIPAELPDCSLPKDLWPPNSRDHSTDSWGLRAKKCSRGLWFSVVPERASSRHIPFHSGQKVCASKYRGNPDFFARILPHGQQGESWQYTRWSNEKQT